MEIGKAAQIVSFHVVAFLIVGLLAARLSERRSSGIELEEATKTLANLRVLHGANNRIDPFGSYHDRS